MELPMIVAQTWKQDNVVKLLAKGIMKRPTQLVIINGVLWQSLDSPIGLEKVACFF